MSRYLFELLLSSLLGLYLGVELPRTYFSTQFCSPFLIVNSFKYSNAHEKNNVCFFGEKASSPSQLLVLVITMKES